MKKKLLCLLLATACVASLLAGCGSKTDTDDSSETNKTSDSDHPVITMNAPYRNMSTFYHLVHEKYPEINLQIIPYNGQNYTSYVNDMRAVGQLPDIYFATYYTPGRYDDAVDFLDMSSYDFTGNYSQSRLREVTYEGAVYMLPLGYNALGITYNKTLFEKNGWSLPANLQELGELKTVAEAAGYTFCRDQLQYPGFGFQYLCNILDTGFLSSMDGIQWQNAFISGEANVEDTPEMMEALQILEQWKDIGMLNADGTPDSDSDTKAGVLEGNTLFLIGNSNDLTAENDSQDEFRLMPYLSEDGNHNVFILNVSRYVGMNKNLGEKGNEKKLEDALKVMEVLSTVEGMESLEPSQNNSRLLPLKTATVNESSYYADVIDELNNGYTANFIYSGWENIVVPLGETMIAYIKGEATLDEVVRSFDDNQHLLTDNAVESYTTVTETISMDDCAKAIGICFAQATGADAALISTNPWTYDPDAYEMNKAGVSGCLFPVPMSDQQIVSILPTGWRSNIETVTLSGKRIKELSQSGLDYLGDGSLVFPYVLVTRDGEELDDDTTYTIPICGVSDAVSEEGNLQDTGILGLDAAHTYFSQFETFSAADIKWE